MVAIQLHFETIGMHNPMVSSKCQNFLTPNGHKQLLAKVPGLRVAPMATPNCSTYGHPNCPRQDGQIMGFEVGVWG